MSELSATAKAFLLTAATLVIGFPTLSASRANDLKSKTVAHGDTSLAYSALTYITWPRESFETDRSPFVIGVLGKPSETHEKLLARYEDGKKQVHGRSVEVRLLDGNRDVSSCHALLVMESCSPETVAEALKLVRGKSVLTIGETGSFAESGGVLSVVKSGNDSVLELNQSAAKRQQLKVDVRLANVSVLIQEQ